MIRPSTLLLATLVLFAESRANAAELMVSAASSLTHVFKEISSQFEAKNPKTKISLNFAASGTLLQQMSKGAPVDVIATADTLTMDEAFKKNLIQAATPRVFARNVLVLVIPIHSTLTVTNLSDLGKASVNRIAVGNPASVSVGHYSKQALDKAGMWPALKSKIIRTESVRQSLDYVARSEVDAAYVYATDANALKDKVKVALQVPLETAITYPIAITTRSAHREDAKRFVDFVTSSEGHEVFAKHGFLKP